jgi:hypothetical protein
MVYVRDNAVHIECDFCGSQSSIPIAAPFEQVLELVREGLETEWTTDSDNSSHVIDADWEVLSYSTEAVLSMAGDPIKNEAVANEVAARFHDDEPWCKKLYHEGGRYERLACNWDDFLYHVIRKSRYFFFVPKSGNIDLFEPATFPTADILDTLGELLRTAGLVRSLPPGERVYRARQGDRRFKTADELGPPPHEHARYSNRMSPAGIVMFYGAREPDTALKETYDPCRKGETILSVGAFVTQRSLRVADLSSPSRLPAIPSLFDRAQRPIRPGIGFLHHFVEQIAMLVVKDGREHVEYIPTQVVTEYLRHVLKDASGEHLDGILYPSHYNTDETCCVFFAESSECGANRDGIRSRQPELWLELDPLSPEYFVPDSSFTFRRK